MNKRFKGHLCCVLTVSVILVTAFMNPAESFAQFAGNRVGATKAAMQSQDFEKDQLSVDEAEGVIVVQGIAEVRIKPIAIRLVLAAVSEGKTAHECKLKAAKLIESLRSGWKAIDVESDDMFEDFIAILPVYKFEEQKRDKMTVLQEVLDGYRYQTNLHAKLAGNEQARKALDVAFELGITEIIAFDYWHPDLEEIKQQALKKAISAAREKSDILLAPELFATRPKLINIREDFKTLFPRTMYHSYTNSINQAVSLPYRYRQDVARISAPRPKTTYYRGPMIQGDSLSPSLPMRPEISVVSRVRLYFQSPHEDKAKKMPLKP